MEASLVTKPDLELLRQQLASVHTELTRKLHTQTRTITIRFGLLLVLGLGLTIAVLRLWSL